MVKNLLDDQNIQWRSIISKFFDYRFMTSRLFSRIQRSSHN